MEKALEILKACRERGQKRAGGLDIDEAISELEEAMKPKTCEGCKFRNTVKFVQVESETLECCSVCVRNCYDYYEPKDNACVKEYFL